MSSTPRISCAPFLVAILAIGAGCGADGSLGPGGELTCDDAVARCGPPDIVAPPDDVAEPPADLTDVAPEDLGPDVAETTDGAADADDAAVEVQDDTTDVDDGEVVTGDCPEGASELCFSTVGECRTGKRLCIGGVWGECRGGVGPTDELCDGLDNDCNGTDDDRDPPCECLDGAVEQCGTTDVGACAFGSRICVDGSWGPCQGNVEPGARLCNDDDMDCNGQADWTQAPCVCRDGNTRSCGTAEGICQEGTETCANGAWGPCLGGVGPLTASANEGAVGLCNGDDDNCDGEVDEGCGCQPPETQTCGTDVGNCSAGTQTCLANGTWGGCVGGVAPTARQCDTEDRDCNGTADWLQAPCQCRNGTTEACGTDVGECVAGTRTCTAGAWGSCAGSVAAVSELCNNKDDDCDGDTDEGLNMPVARPCWTDMEGQQVCADPNTRAVPPLHTVAFDGRTSSDPDGQSLSYSWRIASAPAGSTVTLTNPNSPRPNLFAQVAGTYRVCLTVTDTSLCASDEACVSVAVVPSSRVHIQLLWDKDDADMDLHFMQTSIANFFDYGSNGANANCSKAKDCFYVCPTPGWGGGGTADNPRLDIDNIQGFGPENINLDEPFNGTFPIAVHFWCDMPQVQGYNGPHTGPSTATVRLYIDGVLVRTWTRELTRRQRWHVADLVWNSNNNPPWSTTNRDAVVTTTSPLGCADP